MKKLLTLCAAMLGVVALNAKTIYLNTGGNSLWGVDGPAFFVHAWGSADQDVKMTALDGVYFSAEINDANTSVLFVRMPSGSTSLNWNTAWNQTEDFTIPSGKNCLTITSWDGGADGKSTGTWSYYEGSASAMTYYLAGSGFPGVSWTAGQHLPMTNGTISFTNLAAGTYKFKVTNNTWDYNLGYSAVSASCSSSGYSDDNDGNVVIILLSTGDITIRVDNGTICVTIVGETEQVYASAVPSQCTDVMMQAFYNESYSSSSPGVSEYGNTKWTSLLAQADEIGSYFDLVWLPPSAYGDGAGYHPKQYSNQNSNWGTRSELEALISALHNKGSKVIADIVINHCANKSTWCDFYEMDFGVYGKFQPDASYICANDEVNFSDDAGSCKGAATGSDDDGDNWSGARDWSHDKVYVQDMFKAYLLWMRNVMKYDGFRYDKGDGFNNWHHDNYNKTAQPYIAFMESYNSTETIIGEIEQANRNVMALDFGTRWDAMCGFAGFNYKKCQGSGMLGAGYAKYAVTFIDSHDWFLRPDNENEFGGRGNSMSADLKDRLLQANAYMLGMPGIPCVFYPHWAKYKAELKPMIDARHAAGIHNESAVSDEYAEDGGYQCTVRGKYGWLILQVGNKTTHSNTGEYSWLGDYQLMASGPGYAMWVNVTDPPLPTDIEDLSDTLPRQKGEKFLKEGRLYIRLGDKTYDMMGQVIK